MAIEVACQSCGKILKAKDSAAGKKAKCPDCGSVVEIPEAVYDADYGDDEYSNGAGYDDDGYDDADSGGGGRKPCSVCGEMIVAGAAKCRFCGEIFDPALKKKMKKSGGGSAGGADDDMSTGDWVVAILCSGIGCIAGIVWMIQGKPKGTKMLAISFVAAIFWNIVSAAIRQAANQGPGF